MTYKKMTHSIIATLALGFAATLAAPANGNDYRRIDDLAREIVRCTSKLTREVHHYRHTPQFQHLRDDTREMRRLARRIRTLTNRWGNLNQIAATINDLDHVYHHIQGVLNRVERCAANGVGHVRGNTRHVRVLLNIIADKIHLMRVDIRTLRRIARRGPPHRVNCATGFGHGSGGFGPYGNWRGSDQGFAGFDSRFQSRHRPSAAFDRPGLAYGNANYGFRINY